MNFRSTRHVLGTEGELLSASDAILQGLAKDGGLFVPHRWPQITIGEKERTEADLSSFADFAGQLLQKFFIGDRREDLLGKISAICRRAFDFPLILRDVDEETAILELFHGPTAAFKDFGARFLALCLAEILKSADRPPLVLVATSGDTGGAVAAAFSECTKIPVVVLYPKGRISPRQEKQLTTWGGEDGQTRVHAVAVEGSFDDCQRMVKEAFQTERWRQRFHLISANSINVGRLLPQMAYFAYSSLLHRARHGVEAGFVVPSGNLGNSVGALWARQLGFPVHALLFAHNANQTVPDYFTHGQWQPRPSVETLANAMDVGNPSNFERVRDLYPDGLLELARFASAESVTDDQIRRTIANEKRVTGEVLCPHTSTAMHLRRKQERGNWIVVATAHPAKFETIVEPLIGESVPVPRRLAELLARPSRFDVASANLGDLERVVDSKISL